ncbi:MAG: CvpA family protein [Magnetococcales bacterium]|nr:CvpA family protein [Magnetococcales bacterium]
MTGLDYLLLTVVGFSVVFSMLRPVTLNIITLMGWSMAWVGAGAFFSKLSHDFQLFSSDLLTRESIGFTVVFFGVLVFFTLVGRLLNRWIVPSDLCLSDRLFGLVVGLWRGLQMVILAIGITLYFTVPTTPLVKSSMLLPYAAMGLDRLTDHLPKESKLAAHLTQRRLEFP